VQWPPISIVSHGLTIHKADAIHLDTGRINRHTVASDSGQAFYKVRGRAVTYVEIPTLFCYSENRDWGRADKDKVTFLRVFTCGPVYSGRHAMRPIDAEPCGQRSA
jgi:hypothetical protein